MEGNAQSAADGHRIATVVLGACSSTKSEAAAVCDSSTVGEAVFITASDSYLGKKVEWKGLYNTDFASTPGGKGYDPVLSQGGTQLSWTGGSGCGNDQAYAVTVDRWECVAD